MHDIRENKEELSLLLQALGNALASLLPEGWREAVAGCFFVGEEQALQLQLHVFPADGEEPVDLMELSWDSGAFDDAILEVQRLCAGMRGLCAGAHDAWSSMTFRLSADGAFRIAYGYEPIAAYDARYILRWQSRYLTEGGGAWDS